MREPLEGLDDMDVAALTKEFHRLVNMAGSALAPMFVACEMHQLALHVLRWWRSRCNHIKIST
jgi:hypothetical protein